MVLTRNNEIKPVLLDVLIIQIFLLGNYEEKKTKNKMVLQITQHLIYINKTIRFSEDCHGYMLLQHRKYTHLRVAITVLSCDFEYVGSPTIIVLKMFFNLHTAHSWRKCYRSNTDPI